MLLDLSWYLKLLVALESVIGMFTIPLFVVVLAKRMIR